MAKEITETGRTLIPESHYEAMIQNVKRKDIKGFVIYEWAFEALVSDKPFYFQLGMFSSQMTELLRALGAKETTSNRFEWDMEEVIGITISFNLTHQEDKKGIMRETLSDIKMLTPRNPNSITDPSQVQWGN